MRREDSPELFGCGVGHGTYGDITCGICGRKWNEGENERGVYDNDSIGVTYFAGLEVCECCFEAIETEVFNRMPDILTWFRRIVEKKKKNIENAEKALSAVGA